MQKLEKKILSVKDELEKDKNFGLAKQTVKAIVKRNIQQVCRASLMIAPYVQLKSTYCCNRLQLF